MAEFLFLGAAMAIKVLRKTAEQVLVPSPNLATRSFRDEIEEMREEVEKERQDVEILTNSVNNMQINWYDDLSEHAERQKRTLTKLARRTEAIERQGNNIGVFGLTSTGKSTMVNSLLGRNAAATGVGETTKEITPYQGTQYTLWDAPGRNDELSYSNERYISFIKGLTRRLILIQYTIKENLDLMRLLDNLGLGYDIVVNKFDDIDEDEQEEFQSQIRREIRKFGLIRKKNIFFLSAKYPRQFSDWLRMVDYLTEEYHNYDTDSNMNSDSDSD